MYTFLLACSYVQGIKTRDFAVAWNDALLQLHGKIYMMNRYNYFTEHNNNEAVDYNR